ncbi:hypothetical protein SeMB42_g06731 [Synchytrium endobioticum]|uniref:Uncharacterized protein n=1 Tax=Synchytrium endobioticum TaxID=286115 RepID=A0A507CJP4_9FUNG|nr:hypothetical protein SeMB42_g06731 [Synchytrium endobioticum]
MANLTSSDNDMYNMPMNMSSRRVQVSVVKSAFLGLLDMRAVTPLILAMSVTAMRHFLYDSGFPSNSFKRSAPVHLTAVIVNAAAVVTDEDPDFLDRSGSSGIF